MIRIQIEIGLVIKVLIDFGLGMIIMMYIFISFSCMRVITIM